VCVASFDDNVYAFKAAANSFLRSAVSCGQISSSPAFANGEASAPAAPMAK